MSQLIFLKPKGGLGNQLFQYAAALIFKQTFDGHIFIFSPAANKHSGKDYRTMFEGYPTNVNIFTEYVYYQENAFEAFDPHKFKYNSITLDGYFQHYPSIKSAIPAIIHLFTQSSSIKTVIPEFKEYAFLHIRRGDYLQFRHIHYILPQTYYTFALHQQNNDNILVFSDDPAWCHTQPWLSKYTIVSEPDELSALSMMASCKKGAIIANSTFSWWGAILSGVKMPTFYPSRWISGANPDLFPSEWIRVLC